jgi:hypothetical protein
MDPFLEDPAVWPGMHHLLIGETARALQPLLRSRGYYIDIGERVRLVESGRTVVPDDAIFRSGHATEAPSEPALATADQPVRVRRTPAEVREGYLDIYQVGESRLVTGIEFLSPTNKFDHRGRRLYRRKQRELSRADVNLVEVDLLRKGRHILHVPRPVVEGLRPWDYLVNLVRRGSDDYEIYPIRLRDRLPRILIPLRPPDEDAVLDLQAVFDRAYETDPYPERLNYSGAPVPPLTSDDAAWAYDLLKLKGLR